MIALDGINPNWLACRDLAPAARDSARFLAVGTFCNEVVVVGNVLVWHGGSVANEVIEFRVLVERVAHIWIEATKSGAPYLDFEMWAFAQSANRFPSINQYRSGAHP